MENSIRQAVCRPDRRPKAAERASEEEPVSPTASSTSISGPAFAESSKGLSDDPSNAAESSADKVKVRNIFILLPFPSMMLEGHP